MAILVDQIRNVGGPDCGPAASQPTVVPDHSAQADESSVFDQIDQWPDLGGVFCRRSLAILRQRGFQEWEFEGGVVGPDRRPTFGSPSRAARQIILELATRSIGFRYRLGELFWAAALVGDHAGQPGHWRAIAVGLDIDVRLLCRPQRAACLAQLAARLAELEKPKLAAGATDHEARAHLRRTRRRINRLDLAITLVPLLHRHVRQQKTHKLRLSCRKLAAEVWGRDRSTWSANWRCDLLYAVAALSAVQVETFILPKVGWCHRPISRQPAVSRAAWIDRRTLAVRIAPRFAEFLDCLLVSRLPAGASTEA